MRLRSVWAAVAAAVPLLVACGGEDGAVAPPDMLEGCTVVEYAPIGGDEAPLGLSAAGLVKEHEPRWTYEYRPVTEFGEAFEREELRLGFESAELSQVVWIKESKTLLRDGRLREYEPCPQMITFPATLRFETRQGTFAESVPVRVVAWEDGVVAFHGSVQWKEIQGTFRPEARHGMVGEIYFRGSTLHGQLEGHVSTWARHFSHGWGYSDFVGRWRPSTP